MKSTFRTLLGLILAVALLWATSATAQTYNPRIPAFRDMQLVGFNDLQARSAYQPIIHEQNGRWIAYVGHHGGSALNPLTGVVETNGTSIVDVTIPASPVYLKHIPGPSGVGEAGGAQMVRMCPGSTLPQGIAGKFYLLRATGNEAHDLYDVTDPANPTLLVRVVGNLLGTHKNWWECDTGIAYLVSGIPGWRTNRAMQVFNLSNPANPVFIRNFGLPGQEPGATGPVEISMHGPISLNGRIYVGYGTSRNGILQILDRAELLAGDPNSADRFAPTPENFLFPQISRYDIGPLNGAHTTFPIHGVPVPEFQKFTEGKVRDMVALVNESIGNECREPPQMMYMVDVTTPAEPFGVSNYQVYSKSGGSLDFCDRGGRFGTHSSNENMTPIYYRKIVFLAYFNAGIRAVDIRDPWAPKEVAYYIPAITDNTDVRCVTIGGVQTCKTAIQTNNLEVDDRGYIYAVDRANTGMHIVELIGNARKIVTIP